MTKEVSQDRRDEARGKGIADVFLTILLAVKFYCDCGDYFIRHRRDIGLTLLVAMRFQCGALQRLVLLLILSPPWRALGR